MPGPLARLFTPDALSTSLKVYLPANALYRLVGLLRGVLLTWFLVQDAFGTYQVGLLLAHLLLPVLGAGVYEGVARFVPVYEVRGQLRRFLRLALPYGAACGAAGCGLLLALAGPAGSLLLKAGSAGPAERAGVARVVAACVASLVLYHLTAAVLRGRRSFRALSAMELTAAVVFTAVAVVAAWWGPRSGGEILLLYAATHAACAALFGWPLVAGTGTGGVDPLAAPTAHLARLARYSLAAGWAAALWQILMVFPGWYLQRTCGPAPFAVFGAFRLIAQVGQIGPAVLGIALLGAASRRWETEGRDAALAELSLVTRAGLAAVLCGCLLIAAARHWLVALFPAAYAAGSSLVPVLLLFYVLAGALGLLVLRFALIQRSAFTLASWGAGCLVAVGLSITGVHSGHPGALLGAAWAGAGGAAAALAVALVLLRRRRLWPDRGTLILLAACALLVAPPAACAACAAVLAGLLCLTPLILAPDERRRLLRSVLGGRARV